MEPAASLSPRRQRLLLAAIVSGLLLAMLDQTVVGTALPTIVRDLDGARSYVWVVTAYLVAATVSLPVYARLSDRHGRRALLLVGMALFLVSSAGSASAGSMGQLVGWRALQGLGAGALEGLSFILVADLYRGRRSTALQGVLAGVMGVSFIAGPLIGGALTDGPGWRAVFLINLPIGIAAMAIVAVALPAEVGRSESRTARMDLAGIAVLTAVVGLLLVGLTEHSRATAAGSLPAWGDARTGGLVLLALLLVPVFVGVEQRAASPIVPLRLFADRRLALLLVAGTTASFGLFAGVLLLPRYFQSARDVSATHSGLLIYPLLLGLLVAVNVGAMVISRRSAFRGTLLVGCGFATAGAAGFATFHAGTPDWHALVFMGLIGAGIGPALSGVQIALQRLVKPAEIGVAMGTLLLLRQVGGAVSLAAAGTLYADDLEGTGLATSAIATGHALFLVSLAGTAIAATALIALPRHAGRLPDMNPPSPGPAISS